MPEFRQADADELHRVSGAVFGSWERRADDTTGSRVPGIIERLESLEKLIKIGVAAAGAVGAVLGSTITLLIQHFVK